MTEGFHIAGRAAGLANYYFADKLAQLRALAAAGQDIINLGVGSPDLPAPEIVAKTIEGCAKDAGAFGYQPYRGIPELNQAAIGHFNRDYGLDLHPDGIVPLMGSKEGCGFLALALMDPGDGALVPDPGYPTYASATRLAGGIPLPFPLREASNFHPDVETLDALFMAQRARGCSIRMMWLNYPNMPTGAAPDPARLSTVLQWASERRVFVVHDNPYARILSGPIPFSLLNLTKDSPGVVELHSLSKSHRMAGARMGFAIGTPEAVAPLFRVSTQFGSGMWRPMQKAAAAALGERPEAMEEVNATYAARQQVGTALLESLGCQVRPHQQGLFLWARVPHGWDGDRLSDAVLHGCGVFLAPGVVFGSEGREYLRLSLCSSEDIIRSARHRIDNFNPH